LFEKALTNCELVSYILSGLNLEYDSFVTTITAQLDPISMEELYGHLLTFESWLEQQTTQYLILFFLLPMCLQKPPTIAAPVLHTTTLSEAIHLLAPEEGDVVVALHTTNRILPSTIVACAKSVAKLDTQH